MTQALWRLLLICAAAAAGETIAYQLGAYDVMMWAGIIAALAPFVMRHDNAAEVDGIRAASFGAIPGVKPGTEAGARRPT